VANNAGESPHVWTHVLSKARRKQRARSSRDGICGGYRDAAARPLAGGAGEACEGAPMISTILIIACSWIDPATAISEPGWTPRLR
jgi:hypothetical protein